MIKQQSVPYPICIIRFIRITFFCAAGCSAQLLNMMLHYDGHDLSYRTNRSIRYICIGLAPNVWILVVYLSTGKNALEPSRSTVYNKVSPKPTYSRADTHGNHKTPIQHTQYCVSLVLCSCNDLFATFPWHNQHQRLNRVSSDRSLEHNGVL